MLHYLAPGRGLNPLGYEGQAGDFDPDSRPDVTPGGAPRPSTGSTSDPAGHARCAKMIRRNADTSVRCRKDGKVYVPDPDPCKPGRCVDKPKEKKKPKEETRKPGPTAAPPPAAPSAPAPLASPPELAVKPAQERVKRLLDRAEKVTPEALLEAAPSFDPMIELPPPLPPASLSDALADPRYLQAAAEQDRRIRGGASALGLTGAPVLAASDAARRGLLSSVADQIFGQDLARAGHNLTRGQDAYNRMAGNWERWFKPTTYANDYALRAGALALGGGDQALRAQDQGWRQWWAPESQQRGFGQQRWLAGQNNLMSILAGIAGQGAPQLPAPGW